MMVGQVFYVMGLNQQWESLVKKYYNIYNKILNKSFCFVVELKRLCSKHEQVSLRKERDIEFWVEPFLNAEIIMSPN